jgi:hypothetical protein
MKKKSRKVKGEMRERLDAISEQRMDLDMDAPISRAWQAAENGFPLFQACSLTLISSKGRERKM